MILFEVGTEWMDGVYIPCTYLRLLLPELLREQDKVIWLDTDILLLRDIRLLWNKFTMFDYRHMLAAAPPPDLVKFTCNGQMFRRLKVPSSQRRKFPNFNSGVLLMDLAKLRQSRFMEWVNSMKKYKKELKCGDQVKSPKIET
jgi:lipopolysaccharide biosynthesis glycosyltransferase